jgi:hypothetical protein
MKAAEASAHLLTILRNGLAGECNEEEKAKDTEAISMAIEALGFRNIRWIHDSECQAGQGCNAGCYEADGETQYWAFRARTEGAGGALQGCVATLVEYKTAMMHYYNELEALKESR